MSRFSHGQTQKVRLFLCGFAAIAIVLIANVLTANATSSRYGYDNKDESVEVLEPSAVKHEAAIYISGGEEPENIEEPEYSSTSSDYNAALFKKGKAAINNANVTKAGDGANINSEYYGTNSALFVFEQADISLIGGNINSKSKYANALFVYDSAKASIEKTSILTSGAYSAGIMTAGGGTINAKDVDIATSGDNSAAVRVGRGGGTISLDGGQYKTTGADSPTIYSTDQVSTKNARLEAITSSGIVVDGDGSVELSYSTLTDNNTNTSTGPRTARNIMLYNSNSELSKGGTSKFSATGSTITTKKGDAIYVSNTNAKITLENNSFVSDESGGGFMRIEAMVSGASQSEGGSADVRIKKQNTLGNIYVDRFSTLSLSFSEKSKYSGAINKENVAKRVSLDLSEDSIIVLTDDSYVDRFSNGDPTNKNVYANGHKLYVGGEEQSINEIETVPSVTVDPSKTGAGKEPSEEPEEPVKKQANIGVLIAVMVVAFIMIIFILIAMAVSKSQRKKAAQAAAAQEQARLNLEAQMRAQEQNMNNDKNNYPYPPYA